MQPMKRIVEQYREAKTIIDPEKVIYIYYIIFFNKNTINNKKWD